MLKYLYRVCWLVAPTAASDPCRTTIRSNIHTAQAKWFTHCYPFASRRRAISHMYEGLWPWKRRQQPAPDQNRPTESPPLESDKAILPVLPLLTRPPSGKRAADLSHFTNHLKANPCLWDMMHSLGMNWSQNDIVEIWRSNPHWFTEQGTSLAVFSKLLRKSGLAIGTATSNSTPHFCWRHDSEDGNSHFEIPTHGVPSNHKSMSKHICFSILSIPSGVTKHPREFTDIDHTFGSTANSSQTIPEVSQGIRHALPSQTQQSRVDASNQRNNTECISDRRLLHQAQSIIDKAREHMDLILTQNWNNKLTSCTTMSHHAFHKLQKDPQRMEKTAPRHSHGPFRR